MTPEQEADLRRGGVSATISETRDLLAEIDRLRALPVIATCGECGHTPSRYARPRVCQHPALLAREGVDVAEAVRDAALRAARWRP